MTSYRGARKSANYHDNNCETRDTNIMCKTKNACKCNKPPKHAECLPCVEAISAAMPADWALHSASSGFPSSPSVPMNNIFCKNGFAVGGMTVDSDGVIRTPNTSSGGIYLYTCAVSFVFRNGPLDQERSVSLFVGVNSAIQYNVGIVFTTPAVGEPNPTRTANFSYSCAIFLPRGCNTVELRASYPYDIIVGQTASIDAGTQSLTRLWCVDSHDMNVNICPNLLKF